MTSSATALSLARAQGGGFLLVALMTTLLAGHACAKGFPDAAAQRFAVVYGDGAEDAVAVLSQLEWGGYTLASHYSTIKTYAVYAPAGARAPNSDHTDHLGALIGVQAVHVESVRARPLARKALITSTTPTCGGCKFSDAYLPAHVNQTGDREYLPWGIEMVQGMDQSLGDGSVNNIIICNVGNGVDNTHPDLIGQGLDLQGCSPPYCPTEWSTDTLFSGEYGTGTTGIMAARQNGVGMMGVITGKVSIYTVKVFNESGQSWFYPTDNVDAYQVCENRLSDAKAVNPDTKMVVLINSVGSGPSTMEKLYFQTAAMRGDIMWIAPVGDTYDGTASLQYPAAFAEVISVAAVDCNGVQSVYSNANPDVELSGPGADVGYDVTVGTYAYAAKLTTNATTTNQYPPPEPRFGSNFGSPGYDSEDLNYASGLLVDCGAAANGSCPGARGKVCLIAHSGSSRFPVSATIACQTSGGVGVVGYNSNDSAVCGATGGGAYSNAYYMEDNNVNFTLVPTLTVSYAQAVALKTLLSNNVPVMADIVLGMWNQSLLDRTSATPFAAATVAAVTARVWDLHPRCSAADVRRALRSSALHSGKGMAGGRNYEYGYGIVQAADAAVALGKMACATVTAK